MSFVPKAICPLCSPAYTAILSALGLPFLATAQYLVPLTVTFLAVAVGSLFFRAEIRHGLGPFWAGIVAAMGIIAGKFWLGSTSMTYVGTALLIAASIWNVLPTRNVCPACEAGTPI